MVGDTVCNDDKEESVLGVSSKCNETDKCLQDEAVLVLAKTILIDMLADEMRRIYFRRIGDPFGYLCPNN